MSSSYAPNGKASVWRRQRGKWLAQVDWQDAEGAPPGDGAINELRVKTSDTDATFYLNDKEFKKIEGTPPDKGQQIGIFAASPLGGRGALHLRQSESDQALSAELGGIQPSG